MASSGFEVKGKVISAERGGLFKVEIEEIGIVVLCTISGRLRKNYIKIIEGDKVEVELSISDPTKGRITWRYK